MTGSRVCSSCKESKSFSEFSRSRSPCKACRVIASRKYRKEHPEKVRETNRKWERANPEKRKAQRVRYVQKNKEKILVQAKKYRDSKRRTNADSVLAYHRAWRQKNPKKVALYAKKYRESNPEKVREFCRAWSKQNLEWWRLKSHRRRAQKTNSMLEAITDRDIELKFSLWHYHCAYCLLPQELLPAKLTIDHVVPLCRGGQHTIDNIVPACSRCNSSKGKKLVSEWLATNP